MAKLDRYTFMEQAWGLSRMPIPLDGIRRPSDPFSRPAAAREIDQFEEKFILGGIRGGLTYGYLWSAPAEQLPHEPTGTGYGKTSLMRETERRINHDFGQQLLERFPLAQRPKLVAAYTSLNNEDSRGLYALLFSAVKQWTDSMQCPGPNGRSVFAEARARIVARLGCSEDDEAAIRSEVERVRLNLPGGGSLPPLRESFVSAFVSSNPDDLRDAMSGETSVMRTRNGLAFFETAVAVLLAAGIEHFYVFLDQLEYMVTNRSVGRNQKSREIARFRTVFTEHAALVNRCHVIFTLHDRASQVLQEYWDLNRLPPFDRRMRGNQNTVVVLRGLENPARISDLVRPYLDVVRVPGHAAIGTITPLDTRTFPRLWEESTARPGIILRRIASALDLAAEENREVVDELVITRVLDIPIAEFGDGIEQPVKPADELIG